MSTTNSPSTSLDSSPPEEHSHEAPTAEIPEDGRLAHGWPGACEVIFESDLFDTEFYAEQSLLFGETRNVLVQHYVEQGASAGLNPSHCFDTRFYLRENPDVDEAGMNPLHHYITSGAEQGRLARLSDSLEYAHIRQSPLFDADFYRDAYLSGETDEIDPILHYLKVGAARGYATSADFDTAYYLKANPDVTEDGINPFYHYLTSGAEQGRLPKKPSDQQHFPFDAVYTPEPSPQAWQPTLSIDRSAQQLSQTQLSRLHLGVDPKLVAFYLPQYHRVPENDEWWGDGFTEWTNVRKAKPNYAGHIQPKVPLGDNYYDLEQPKSQEWQYSLAKEYGIGAFCYYMYWFNGRRILEKPLDNMLHNKNLGMEFCVCWANENWTRTWDGKDNDVLLAQVQDADSDRRFIVDAMKYFADSRYLRVDGKLLLLVYRVDLLKNPRQTAEIWRDAVRKAGLGDLCLAAVQFYGIHDPRDWGFDVAVEFPPHGWLIQDNVPDVRPDQTDPDFQGSFLDYTKSIDFALCKLIPDFRWYRGVMPGWDNTARRQHTSHTFVGSNAFSFERWLTAVLRQTVLLRPPHDQLVFINAWNEWGEGAYLEPDADFGLINLMAVNSALATIRSEQDVIPLMQRLRAPQSQNSRLEAELALLNIFRGQEQALRSLAHELIQSRR